ncbi:MAG: rhomboid family intramembrane serine protease [Nitrospiraceae bacterium]|nr:MAG: rhomboid family intramembrane serine protease [Nitrospiraceae bacterium]
MRYTDSWRLGKAFTPVVRYLIFINAGISVFELLLQVNLATYFGLSPLNFWRGFFWQPVTYMFLHGGFFHLLINMFILWMFGTTLEATWGSRRFLKFYMICGIGAGLLNAAVTPGTVIPTVGASGAIYGLLMAFGILFPDQIILVWGIFPVKARIFVIGLGIIELLTALSTTHSNIAHFAHLGGMLFGLIYMKWDEGKRLLYAWRGEQRRRHDLKVVWNRDREREKLQKDIDALLSKINENGMDSLTDEERDRLTAASKKMRKWEEE